MGFDRHHHRETPSFPAMGSVREETGMRGWGDLRGPEIQGLGMRKCAHDNSASPGCQGSQGYLCTEMTGTE